MTTVQRRWVRLIIAAAALLAALVAFGLFLMYPAFRSPPPPSFPAPTSRAEANRQDLAYARRAMHALDRSFSPREWARFDAALDDLSRRAADLDPAALEMGVAAAVAASGNGHTNLLGAARGLTLNSVPLRFYWFSGGLFVVKADAAHAHLLGARVLTLAGLTPQRLAARLGPYVGGREALRRELSLNLMLSPQALRAAGLQGSAAETRLTLETRDGAVQAVTLAAAPIPATGPAPAASPQTLRFDPRELYWPRRELSPVRLPAAAPYPRPTGDGRVWRQVLDGKPLPLSLRNPDRFYWAADAAPGVLFVQINAMIDEPGRPTLRAFLDHTLKDIETRRPRSVVVDLRANPGGSYQLPARFAEALPRALRPDGKVFVLTSANTFSASVVTVARLKHFLGPRGEIVGEPLGDDPRFWAEAAGRIVLPNSRLRIGYATGYHDWKSGCALAEILVCYPPNYLMGVAAGDLDPTTPVAWSFADYLAGTDPAVERIVRRP